MTDASHRPDSGLGTTGAFPKLYPIIDVDLCGMRGLAPAAVAAASLQGGARLLQVRQKGSAGGSQQLLAIIRDIVSAAQARGARVIVNDRADLALLAGADGVHVGQQDLPAAVVRRLLGPDAIIGVSTHSLEQVDEALAAPVDYIAVGPIFNTSTKDTGYTARGLDLVRAAAGRGKPVVAIGGVALENAGSILAAGASSVAIISDLLSDADPGARVRHYLARLTAAD